MEQSSWKQTNPPLTCINVKTKIPEKFKNNGMQEQCILKFP